MLSNIKSDAEVEYLTSGEAARILGVSQVTVSTMAADGRLPVAFIVGGNRVYARAVVEALAQQRAQEK